MNDGFHSFECRNRMLEYVPRIESDVIIGSSEKVHPGLFSARKAKTQFPLFSQKQLHKVIDFGGTFTTGKWCMQILHDSMEGGGTIPRMESVESSQERRPRTTLGLTHGCV